MEYHTAALARALLAVLQIGGKCCFRCQATGHIAVKCPQRGMGGGCGNHAPPLLVPGVEKSGTGLASAIQNITQKVDPCIHGREMGGGVWGEATQLHKCPGP